MLVSRAADPEDEPGQSRFSVKRALKSVTARFTGPSFGPPARATLRVFASHLEIDQQAVKFTDVSRLRRQRRQFDFHAPQATIRLAVLGLIPPGCRNSNLTRLVFELLSACAAQDPKRTASCVVLIARVRLADQLLIAYLLLLAMAPVILFLDLYRERIMLPILALMSFCILLCLVVGLAFHWWFTRRCARDLTVD